MRDMRWYMQDNWFLSYIYHPLCPSLDIIYPFLPGMGNGFSELKPTHFHQRFGILLWALVLISFPDLFPFITQDLVLGGEDLPVTTTLSTLVKYPPQPISFDSPKSSSILTAAPSCVGWESAGLLRWSTCTEDNWRWRSSRSARRWGWSS